MLFWVYVIGEAFVWVFPLVLYTDSPQAGSWGHFGLLAQPQCIPCSLQPEPRRSSALLQAKFVPSWVKIILKVGQKTTAQTSAPHSPGVLLFDSKPSMATT